MSETRGKSGVSNSLVSEFKAAAEIACSTLSQAETLFNTIIDMAGENKDIANLALTGAYLSATNADTVDDLCSNALKTYKNN